MSHQPQKRSLTNIKVIISCHKKVGVALSGCKELIKGSRNKAYQTALAKDMKTLFAIVAFHICNGRGAFGLVSR
jgi:hypothetical protein